MRSYRQEITKQALQVLTFCSQSTLESHGESMVIKIREIAATLLEQAQEQVATLPIGSDEIWTQRGDGIEETMDGQNFIMASFLQILANLDYAN